MSFTYAALTDTPSTVIGFAPSPSGSVYTHVSGSIGKSYARNFVFHNTDATDEIVQAWFVPSGSVPSLANRFLCETVPTGATFIAEFAIPGLVMLNSGDALWVGAANPSKVTLMIFGGQE